MNRQASGGLKRASIVNWKTWSIQRASSKIKKFEQTRKALDARCKLLKKKEGRGNRPFAAEAISDDEVSVLYESNILGISSTEA